MLYLFASLALSTPLFSDAELPYPETDQPQRMVCNRSLAEPSADRGTTTAQPGLSRGSHLPQPESASASRAA